MFDGLEMLAKMRRLTLMRILVLSPYLPYPPHSGGRIRILELLRFLQPRHEITVVAFAIHEGELLQVEGLSRYCERVVAVPRKKTIIADDDLHPRRIAEFSTAEMRETLLLLNEKYSFDLIDIEHIFMAQYAPLIKAPAILQEHNIESQLLKRYAELSQDNEGGKPKIYTPSEQFRDARTEWKKLAAYEAMEWPKFPVRVTVSNLDREEMLKRCPSGRVVTIPNGVDTKSLLPVGYSDSAGVLFTGGMFYQPNLDAAFDLCDFIWPLVVKQVPEACLYIVGREPPTELLARQKPGQVEIIADAPDLVPYATKCCLSVVPVKVGGGTRLKILTAMSLGLPVVSTSVGCEGLELKDNVELLVADEPVQFAQKIVYLLQHKDKRILLARTGRTIVETRYEWQHIFSKLENLFEEVAAFPY
jgi:glycosyltransferase involved in cell wall biosynthesis